MYPRSAIARLRLLMMVLLSLGLVVTALHLIPHNLPDKSSSPATSNQQAIDCTKNSKNLAAIAEQTQQPDQCLYLGCSGFFQ